MASNIVPLRLTVRSSMSISEVIVETAREMSELSIHQRYPIADLCGIANERVYGVAVNFMPFAYTHPIKPTSTRCPPHGGLTSAEAPLIGAEKLFREPGPPQRSYRDHDLKKHE
jgi:hypothetical protein